jgi:hypothetical protein
MEGKVTLNATNGAKIVVWRHGDLFCATRPDAVEQPEECLAIDLFEVIAELCGLDLEQGDQAAEALELAEAALRRLKVVERSDPASGNGEPASEARG